MYSWLWLIDDSKGIEHGLSALVFLQQRTSVAIEDFHFDGLLIFHIIIFQIIFEGLATDHFLKFPSLL